jgi:hypothetical protein
LDEIIGTDILTAILRDEQPHHRRLCQFTLFDVALLCSTEILDHTTKWYFYLFFFHPFLSILHLGELNEGKSA